MEQVAQRIEGVLRPRREAAWWLRVGVVICALLALALLLLTRFSAPAPTSGAALIGRQAPTFALHVAQGGKASSGATIYTFAAADAKPTLLVFFNTLCVHCLSEIPAIQQAAQQTPLNVLYIDSPGENAQITGAYMARQRLDPPVLLDPGGNVGSAYQVNYRPTVILIDNQGIVRAVWTGETSAATLNAGIAAALH